MKKVFTAVLVVACVVLFAWITNGSNAHSRITDKDAFELREKSESHFRSPRLTDAVASELEIDISEDFVFAKGRTIYYYYYHNGEWKNIKMVFPFIEDQYRFLDEEVPQEEPLFTVDGDELVVRYLKR